MPYSPHWRKLRAIVHKLLTPKSSNTFIPSQEFESKRLMWDILTDNENQENFYMHIRRYTTSGWLQPSPKIHHDMRLAKNHHSSGNDLDLWTTGPHMGMLFASSTCRINFLINPSLIGRTAKMFVRYMV